MSAVAVRVIVKVAPEADTATPATGAATAVSVISLVTAVPFGLVSTRTVCKPDPSEAAAKSMFTSIEIAVPTAAGVAPFAATAVGPETEITGVRVAAFAGATDKSPNPSEATATTATFFNEIVFTIFLSFSQIKDDLLSGW